MEGGCVHHQTQPPLVNAPLLYLQSFVSSNLS